MCQSEYSGSHGPSGPSINGVAQVLAGVPIDMEIFVIFIQGFNCIEDVYLWIASSAISTDKCGVSLDLDFQYLLQQFTIDLVSNGRAVFSGSL